jgi:hypothetical protein
MAAPDRVITQTGTGPAVSGSIQDEITGLWSDSDIHLTGVAGTANAITANLVPALTAGMTAGMKFSFIPTLNNTGAATISINGGAAIALVNDDGAALIANQIVAGRLHRAVSDGTSLRVGGTATILKINDYQAFTASGTWTKPAGTPANALVNILVWAGGGGGGTGTSNSVSGGGGGGFVRYQCRASDLASSVAITIGAGGTVANAGGASSFGTLVTAFGGGAGINQGSQGGAGGGGGGGALGAGGNGLGASGTTPGAGGAGGDITAGTGATGTGAGSAVNPGTQPVGGNGYFGGGGGGTSATGNTTNGSAGGRSVYGGAGGAGRPSASAATSLYGGNGGASGLAGAAPGGGGGSNAAGARGEVRVYVNG